LLSDSEKLHNQRNWNKRPSENCTKGKLLQEQHQYPQPHSCYRTAQDPPPNIAPKNRVTVSRNMQYVSQVATHKLGFAKFDYHSLRHTYAMILAEKSAAPNMCGTVLRIKIFR